MARYDKRLQLLISDEELTQLDKIAAAYGWTRAQTIRTLIRQAYNEGVKGGAGAGTTTGPYGGHWSLVTGAPENADQRITWPEDGAVIL